MARFHLPLFPGCPALPDPPAWLQDLVMLGTSRADTLTAEEATRFVFGFGGNDQIIAEGRSEGPGVSLLGGAGDDVITAGGARNLLFGGAGDDTIRLPFGNFGFTADSLAYGGSGNDAMYAEGNGNTLRGGSGADSLEVTGFRARDNAAYGGSGDDSVAGTGFNTKLDGGAGDDVLAGSSFGISVFYTEDDGTFMTGGAGTDTFNPVNGSLLLVYKDLDGTVSAGDEIGGVFNVITDYEAGERIGIGPLVRQDGPVDLIGPRPGPSEYPSPDIEIGQYAEFRGALIGPGRFAVQEEGPDLMIVTASEDVADNYGTLVLQDWSGGDPLIA
jgi:Ca2+-binding RTX toxin-like protein